MSYILSFYIFIFLKAAIYIFLMLFFSSLSHISFAMGIISILFEALSNIILAKALAALHLTTLPSWAVFFIICNTHSDN